MGRLSDTVGRRKVWCVPASYTPAHPFPPLRYVILYRARANLQPGNLQLDDWAADWLCVLCLHRMTAALVGSVQPAVLFFSQSLLKHTPYVRTATCNGLQSCVGLTYSALTMDADIALCACLLARADVVLLRGAFAYISRSSALSLSHSISVFPLYDLTKRAPQIIPLAGFAGGISNAYIADIMPPEWRGIAFSSLMAVSSASQVLGPLVDLIHFPGRCERATARLSNSIRGSDASVASATVSSGVRAQPCHAEFADVTPP